MGTDEPALVKSRCRRQFLCSRRFWQLLQTAVLLIVSPTVLRADKITLSDGRIFEGRLSRLNTMNLTPGLNPVSTHLANLIVMVDNELSRSYVPFKYVQNIDPAPAGQRLEAIEVPQRVATVGSRIGSVGSIVRISGWDENGEPGFGRRIFSMKGGPQGQIDVVQGITKITPLWCRVQGLQPGVTPAHIWDMRIATSSVPQSTLSAIIRKLIDPKKVDDRLKVVRVYLQAERYKEAEAELNEIIQDFPARTELADVARELRQLRAKQALQEIDTRRKSRQHQLVFSMLDQFPTEGVDGQILQQVRAKVDEYSELDKQGRAIHKQLAELTSTLPESPMRQRVETVVKEMTDELTANTLDRMSTYRRFANDAQASTESKLALAISGWLMGAGEATENLSTALAAFELRNLVRAYLIESDKLRRDETLAKIQAHETVTPKLIAALANHMKPYKETPPQELSGFYELSVPGVPNEADVTYYVQLPPEYDPHVNYPCIVTLNGAGSTPKLQIDWWADQFNKEQTMRVGHAARYGYIVIAPVWTKPHQTHYDGSLREHDAVLSVLRDACRRFAVDTDRVYLSGHSMGGNAAWDMGLAHPDLWAGVIPIVAVTDKTIQQYWKNADSVPLYFVCGEMDGDKMVKNSVEFDRYINRSAASDCTIVEFQGRGHEHFSDEILRLFDWMGRKQRNFFPRKISVDTQRPWDNFFWWLELRDFQPNDHKFRIEASLTATNGVSIQTGAKVTVWLAPEMVDFSRPIVVTQKGKSLVPSKSIRPDLSVLLEDIRTRGDRQHPFWAKVE